MTASTQSTILVIDDEPSIVRGLSRLLHQEGYQVATASNGCEALAQLQRQRYDVILTDLRMPKLDGCAFYAQLRQRWPALSQRVIFLTGVSDDPDSQAFLARSGRPWLPKPFAIVALRRLIHQVLGTAASRDAIRNARTSHGARPGCPCLLPVPSSPVLPRVPCVPRPLALL